MTKFILEPTEYRRHGEMMYKIWIESPDGTSRHLLTCTTKTKFKKEFNYEYV